MEYEINIWIVWLIYVYMTSYADGYSVDWHDLMNDHSFVNDIDIDKKNENENLKNPKLDYIRIGDEDYFEMTVVQIIICIFCAFTIGMTIGSILINCLHCCTTAYRNSFKH